MYSYKIDIPYEINDEFWFLLCGDIHADDRKHDEELFLYEFEKALDLDAKIIINGDTISGIFYKDPRWRPDTSDPSREDIIDYTVDKLVEKFFKYIVTHIRYIC